jgi:hypothetical protein
MLGAISQPVTLLIRLVASTYLSVRYSVNKLGYYTLLAGVFTIF